MKLVLTMCMCNVTFIQCSAKLKCCDYYTESRTSHYSTFPPRRLVALKELQLLLVDSSPTLPTDKTATKVLVNKAYKSWMQNIPVLISGIRHQTSQITHIKYTGECAKDSKCKKSSDMISLEPVELEHVKISNPLPYPQLHLDELSISS